MEQEIRLSVRELAEFLLRSGSLDNRYGGFDRANEGSRIHRRLQKLAGTNYQAEVPLSLHIERQGFSYLVEGRADGILHEQGGDLIDEIKTVACPVTSITEDMNQAHWGQAMVYAHIWCVQQSLDSISVRLTYFQVDTEEIIRFIHHYTSAELGTFFLSLLDQYSKWAELSRTWAETRNTAIRALAFPFDAYRQGQHHMAATVYRTIAASGRLFCQAPTGIGKTMSTLFPAIKAMGEGLTERIFYLTAKTITRQAAEEALERMRNRGLRIKSITLTAKDKICFLDEPDCNPEACPYANGYYDRINDVLYRLVKSDEAFTRTSIETAARDGRVCPFELSLDLTLWCDVIVCDYNYLFDPVVSLKRFFSERKGDYVFLVDEAHNLLDRARGMYSAALTKSAFLQLKKSASGEKKLCKTLNKVNSVMLALRKACPEDTGYKVDAKPSEELLSALTQFNASCDEWLERNRHAALHRDVLMLYFETRFFLRIAEIYDEHYITYTTAEPGSQATVQLLCLDPSEQLDACMAHGRASVLFSATLSPPDYFHTVLGGGEDAHQITLPSPFSPEHLHVLLADRISTKYADRANSLPAVAALLGTFTTARAGNYIIFFPSYRYLRDVYDEFCIQYPDVRTIVQTGGMDETAREDFLAGFTADGDTLVGFCVMGGVFSEGVDLKGDRLIGAAIVGVGLPQISVEQDLLRDYYSQHYGSGFDYAYRFPGMNKVLQAAGRVIRSEEDHGVVLLIDSRFSTAAYRPLFPPHWGHRRTISDSEQLESELSRFWHTTPQPPFDHT